MNKEIEIPEGYKARIEANKVIFEPKESEDERTRKFLVKHVSEWIGCIEHDLKLSSKDVESEEELVMFKACLAYLERQKEQKPVKLDDDTEVGLDRALQIVRAAKGNLCGYQSDDGIYECCHAIQTLERILKSGIEQQPAEWSFPYGVNETVDRLIAIAECLEMDGNCLFNEHTGTECGKFLRELARKQIGCKPAEWSEEDEDTLGDAISAADILGNDESFNKGNPHLAKAFRVAKDWLRALPERLNLSSEQKWSEGDKRKINRIYEILGHAADDKGFLASKRIIGDKEAIELQDWLKSLRPQPKEQYIEKYPEDKSFEDEWKDYYNNSLVSRLPMNKRQVAKHFYWFSKKNAWKPSKEQMEALEHFIRGWGESGAMSPQNPTLCAANSLYADLQKLL